MLTVQEIGRRLETILLEPVSRFDQKPLKVLLAEIKAQQAPPAVVPFPDGKFNSKQALECKEFIAYAERHPDVMEISGRGKETDYSTERTLGFMMQADQGKIIRLSDKQQRWFNSAIEAMSKHKQRF